MGVVVGAPAAGTGRLVMGAAGVVGFVVCIVGVGATGGGCGLAAGGAAGGGMSGGIVLTGEMREGILSKGTGPVFTETGGNVDTTAGAEEATERD